MHILKSCLSLRKKQENREMHPFILTIFSPVDLAILIIWMSPFLVLGVSGGWFNF